MNRRTVLAGCGCATSLVMAGCIDDSSDEDAADGNDGGGTEDEEPESFYELQISSPTAEEPDSCAFDDLPKGAQTEFESAIEDAEFESEERVTYRLEDSPEILDTNCYGQHIEFEGEYYEVNVIAAGG